MSLSPEIVVQLTAYKDAGDVAGYYSVLDANGHDYGNIAYEAATDTGLWGQYANNFLENKASECCHGRLMVSFHDRRVSFFLGIFFLFMASFCIYILAFSP
jgi:hypothetical protein